MKKIPTAEEFYHLKAQTKFVKIEEIMIEFAKLHVEAAKQSKGRWSDEDMRKALEFGFDRGREGDFTSEQENNFYQLIKEPQFEVEEENITLPKKDGVIFTKF